jgi:enoyl-CoA hydratase
MVFDLIERLGKPVIAAINGFALGGGCELAMACTIRVAADSARFGQPEINLGIIPGYAGSQRLPRLVGKGRALEILLTGDMISAARAYEIGLVNKVVAAADLLPEARKFATALASKAPLATRYILEAVHHGMEMPLADGQFLEGTLFGLVASTDDMKEGTRAFLEKRQAAWRGR